MEQNQNQSVLAAEMNYQCTEQDYQTAMQNYYKIIVNKGRMPKHIKLAIIWSVVILCMTALAIISPPDSSEIFSFSVLFAFLLGMMIFLLAGIPASRRKHIAKAIENARNSGELNLATKVCFYNDRVEMMNSMYHSINAFAEIPKVCELANGLYIIYQNGQFTYIPARFFSRDTAPQITSLMQQGLGAKYVRYALMEVPDAAEYAGEPSGPMVEETEPKYEFDFVMEQKDVAAIARGGGLIRSVITTVIFAIAGTGCIGYYLAQENAAGLVYIAGLLLFVIALFRAMIIFKSFSMNKFAPKNMNQKYFDDHVTIITEKSVKKRFYTDIAGVKRIKGTLRVVLKNNVFFYVPESAAQSAEQFAEFEKFISQFAGKKK